MVRTILMQKYLFRKATTSIGSTDLITTLAENLEDAVLITE